MFSVGLQNAEITTPTCIDRFCVSAGGRAYVERKVQQGQEEFSSYEDKSNEVHYKTINNLEEDKPKIRRAVEDDPRKFLERFLESGGCSFLDSESVGEDIEPDESEEEKDDIKKFLENYISSR